MRDSAPRDNLDNLMVTSSLRGQLEVHRPSICYGYWVDSRWDTTPYGLVIGAVVGFAAMVLRLLRLGKELHPDPDPTEDTSEVGSNEPKPGHPMTRVADDLGVGEAAGMSSVLRDDDEDGNGGTE